MRPIRIVVALAALALATVAVGSAAAATVTFTGNYKGKVTERVAGSQITALATGTGLGTLIGKSSVTGTVVATTVADSPCAPFTGPGTIKGPKGTLKLSVLTGSRGCAASEDDRDNISMAGSAKVLGGTGTFAKARGTLRFTGHYDRSTGAFTLKLTGKLTY